MADWQTLYYRMKNCAAGYSNFCDESGSTRKLEREFEQIDSDARSLKSSPPVAVQKEGDAKDGARYREFFASGLPITFLGVEYRTKAELDAAIDAVKGDQP